MPLNEAERFLLFQATIVRRVPRNRWIPSQTLMEALQADDALVAEQCPEYWYQYFQLNLSQELAVCIEEGLVESSSRGFKRTADGERLLTSLEPHLAEVLDAMPMSKVGVLDFLSLL